MKRKKWDAAKELADTLFEWNRKRGVPPVTVGDKSPMLRQLEILGLKQFSGATTERLMSSTLPTPSLDKALGKEWHRTVTHFTCLLVISKVDDIYKRREQRKANTESKGEN